MVARVVCGVESAVVSCCSACSSNPYRGLQEADEYQTGPLGAPAPHRQRNQPTRRSASRCHQPRPSTYPLRQPQHRTDKPHTPRASPPTRTMPRRIHQPHRTPDQQHPIRKTNTTTGNTTSLNQTAVATALDDLTPARPNTRGKTGQRRPYVQWESALAYCKDAGDTQRLCQCGCGKPLTRRLKYASNTCRIRHNRRNGSGRAKY